MIFFSFGEKITIVVILILIFTFIYNLDSSLFNY